jgi:hypothetical protein
LFIFISLFDYNSSGCVWNETIDNELREKVFSSFSRPTKVHRWYWVFKSAHAPKGQHIL